MHSSWQSLAVTFLAWAHSTASTPLGPVTGNQGLNLLNLPNLHPVSFSNLSMPDIPRIFKFRPMIHRSADWPLEAYWLNAMVATQAAASGDYDSPMQAFEFHSQRFSIPVVSATTPPPEVKPSIIIRKYFIWAIYLGVSYMDQFNRYGFSVFGVENGDEDIGVVTFGPPHPSPVYGNLTTDIIPPEKQELLSLNPVTGAIESTNATAPAADPTMNSLLISSLATTPDNMSTTAASDETSTFTNTTTTLSETLTISWTRVGPPLEMKHVLPVLHSAIADTAPLQSDHQVLFPWVSQLGDQHFQVRVTPVARTQAPYLKFEDIAAAMVNAADWMIGSKDYGCFRGVPIIDNVPVGLIVFQHQR